MADRKAEILEIMREDAARSGYYLCPEQELLDGFIEGLYKNEERYGYYPCPCRLACGVRTYDSDIICPCEYRDADVDEFGMCYCGLFVSEEVHENPSKLGPIPERRPPAAQQAALEAMEKREKGELAEPEPPEQGTATIAFKGRAEEKILVWRCKVCGYLCAREGPPPVCPICKAKADRFERFGLS